MSGPTVSIVVNNYNYGRFLRAAVDSALGQSYPGTQVLVVDDGSTDDSRHILGSYGSAIECILKSNGGQASALNAGIARARGDLVLFLDADDRLRSDAVARVAAAWRPGVSKVQFPLERIDAAGIPRGVFLPPVPLPSGDLRSLVRRTGLYPSPPTTGNAFARSVLERLMPIPEREWGPWADTFLIVLAPFFGEVVSLPDVLGQYRVHGANSWAVEQVTVERLHDYLRCDEVKAATLRSRSDTGWTPPDNWLLVSMPHVQARLASLRLDPASHPYPADARWWLALRGLLTCGLAPGVPVRKRILAAAWFLAAAALPQRLVRGAVDRSYLAERRGRLLSLLLGRRPMARVA